MRGTEASALASRRRLGFLFRFTQKSYAAYEVRDKPRRLARVWEEGETGGGETTNEPDQ